MLASRCLGRSGKAKLPWLKKLNMYISGQCPMRDVKCGKTR
jgi:hypothetical protein